MQDFLKQQFPTFLIVAGLLLAMQVILVAPAERRVERRFERIEARLIKLGERFGGIEARFDAFERRVEERFGEFHKRFDAFERRVDERFDVLDKMLGERLDKLEADLAVTKGRFDQEWQPQREELQE